MLFIDRALHRIRAYADAAGLDAEMFGRKAGVPGSTARRLLRGRGNPTYRLIAAMEAVIPADFVDDQPVPVRKPAGASGYASDAPGAPL